MLSVSIEILCFYHLDICIYSCCILLQSPLHGERIRDKFSFYFCCESIVYYYLSVSMAKYQMLQIIDREPGLMRKYIGQ